MADFWIATLADGSTHEERWLAGYISPWQRLMEYCKKQVTYITALRLVMGGYTKSCPPNAIGYWQAHAMPSAQAVICDEELHKWRGIGWVEQDKVKIIWGARDPVTHIEIFWGDERQAEHQQQIIWSPKLTVTKLEDIMEVPRSTVDVRGVKEYTDRIIQTN